MTETKKFTDAGARRLYREADAAGMAAMAAARPTPMVVGTPKNMMASLTGGDDGGFDESQPVYYVAGGVCGFAWVTIRPATSSLARRFKKLGYASPAYGGGMQVWIREGGQSMELKEAYGRAFAEVLRSAGVDAYMDSRMD